MKPLNKVKNIIEKGKIYIKECPVEIGGKLFQGGYSVLGKEEVSFYVPIENIIELQEKKNGRKK